ncbi:MAG TPA: hypothetical protein ENK14_04790 [Caldithrix sp.]|nr:hypothetical protein [Caldithrix sp.]
MKFRKLYLLSSLILFALFTGIFARSGVEIEFDPIKMLRNSNRLPLELTISNFSGVPVSEVVVLYRYSGDSRFQIKQMNNEGLHYYASLTVKNTSENMIEYYYRIRYMDQRSETFPGDAASGNLFRTALQYDRNYGEDIVIISPEPDEHIYSNEVVITASFARLTDMIDVEKSKLFLDNWEVTRSRYLQKFDDFISFSPRQIPAGRHRIWLELYDKNSVLVASKEWYFTAIRSRISVTSEEDFQINGRFFAEARRENLQDGSQINDYNQTGLQLNGGVDAFEYGGRLYFNNQESADRQPINRFSGYARLNFWNHRYLKVAVGDAYPKFNSLIMQNILLRGYQTSLFLKFLNIDFAKGKTLRAIEGEITTDTTASGQQSIRAGTYRRNILAVRPSFGDGKIFQLGFTYLKGRDDTTSIQFGLNPQENTALGADLMLGLDKQRILLEGNIGTSVYNRNITGGSIPYDTLIATLQDSSDFKEEYYNLAKKIITINQYLILRPGVAYQGRIRLRYFRNNLSLLYESIDEDYYSLGQPYMLRDNRGFHLVDNWSLLKNQVFLTVGYRRYHNNLQETKAHTSTNKNLYFNLSYFPMKNLPEMTFGFNNYTRDNGVPEDSLNSILNRPEDNKTNTINFTTSYRFNLANLRHRISLNLMNYRRSDIFKYAESRSDYFSLNLKSNFNVPLQTLLEFILQQTETGKDTDREGTLSFTTFGAGINYVFENLFTRDRLTLNAKARFGKISSEYKLYVDPQSTGSTSFDYNRNYFSFRLNYTVPRFGNIGLLADILAYSGDKNKKDVIYSARYDYSF